VRVDTNQKSKIKYQKSKIGHVRRRGYVSHQKGEFKRGAAPLRKNLFPLP
jgi:hypothetical protein